MALLLNRGRKRETTTKIPILGYGKGLDILADVNRLDPAALIRGWDVNLDRPGATVGRFGMAYLAENPLGAQQISDFETDETWTGTGVSADTSNFREHEVDADGVQGLRLTPVTNQCVATRSGLSLNLGPDLDELIGFWIYYADIADVLSVQIDLRSSVGNNYRHIITAPPAANGSALYLVPKSQFTVVGSPDWTSITTIVLTFNSNSLGSYITFDNLYVAPKQTDGLYNFRQSPSKGGGNFKIGAARGVLAYLDEYAQRWVPLKTGLPQYVPYSFITFGDICYVCNGDRVYAIHGDGAGALTPETVYVAGIDPPRAAPVLTELTGGVLPVGQHDYKIVPFSTRTGKEGNSVVDANGATVLISITTLANAKVQLSSIPLLADPKVTHWRIYRRDSTDGNYRRVSKDINGEVTNGTSVYEDNTANTALGDELEGRSTYVLNSPPPSLSMMAVVGDRVIGSGNPAAPTRVYVSRSNSAEQWDIVDASLEAGLNDNDVVSSVSDVDGFAAIGKERAVFIGRPVSGPIGFAFEKKESHAGPVSHRSVIVLGGVMYYRSHDGYYAMGRDWIARKISRSWEQGQNATGFAEPAFENFDSSRPTYVCGAYVKRRAQILWTDTRSGARLPDIVPVLHVGHLEGTRGEDSAGGAVGGWAFHRYANGNALAGLSCLANYIDIPTGKHLVMGGGPGGFVYRLDSGELDDVLPTGRVAVDSDIQQPFYSIPGAAMGQHVQKDFVEDHLVFAPLGNWPVTLEYYRDWSSQAYHSTTVTPIGAADISVVADPTTPAAFYASMGVYKTVPLPARRSRNISRRVRNNTLGQTFWFAESTWFVEWLGSEGVK